MVLTISTLELSVVATAITITGIAIVGIAVDGAPSIISPEGTDTPQDQEETK